jgi:P4 family phage/plasmid primase-like protien
MGEAQHVGATFLADVFGSSTVNPVFICSLINGDAREGSAGAGERFVTTRIPDYISAFAHKWDIARRGVFWCVSTVTRDARRRAKETLAELNCLHADIDFRDLEEDPETVRRVLANLRYPPSMVTASGNGLHPLWLFKEAIEATPETIADIEQLLQRLTDLLGADPSAAECSRLLRLPGTHNSKNGSWNEVIVEVSRPTLRYELDDLRDWLELAPQPLLRRRKPASNGQSLDNPFLAAARRQGFKPPVDVAARLAAMRYQGPGDSGIHLTQLAVSASLLNHGESIDDVVALLLEATRIAAGEDGQRWNWAREERDLRGMCEDWLEKHPEIAAAEPGASEPSGPEPGGPEPSGPEPSGPEPDATGTGAGAGSATGTASTATGSTSSAPGSTAAPRKAGKRKYGKYGQSALIIADGVIEAIRRDGGDLLLTEGELHLYRDGLWSPADSAIEQRLRVLIQEGADALREADPRILSAAWKRLKEHPALYRAHVDWDAAGKVGLTNGVLDLISRAFTPWAPEHYLRHQLGVAYDPEATAPRIVRFLTELFGDRDPPIRAALIDLLQQFTGAALCVRLLHREQRRALFLIGPSRTGKSELARLFGHLFGTPIASPSVGDLGDRFGLECFYGAMAWVRDDAVNEGDKLNPQHFKTIVTGEPIDIRRKNKGAVRVELAIPVVLTANALPAARDASDAVFNRSLVLDMTRVFDETNAIDARRKFGVPPGRWLGDWLFEQEGPGFLNWALEGLARLLKQGAFVIPECVLTAIHNFQREGDIVVDFARTALERSGSTRIARGDVVCAFHGWRRDDEGDKARLYGGRWLIPRLRIACPWIFHRTSDGVRYLCGAKLTEEGLKHWARQATVAAQGGRGAEGESTNKDEVNRPWDVHALG